MASHVGWRNFWWLIVGLNILCIICQVFLFPETKFNRPHVTSTKKTMSSGSPINKGSDEKVMTPKDPENGITMEETSPNHLEPALTHQDPYLGRGKPSKQQWKLWQPYEGNILKEFWLPWKLHAYPIVQFAAFVVSWTASCFLTLNLTQTQAFAADPYNYDSQTIGFFNFAILVGAMIGLFTAGPLSDWISAKLTERNRGIREPEMRLLTMIPYVLIMILGNVVVAVGYQYSWDWRVSPLYHPCQKSGNAAILIPFPGHRNNRLYLRWHRSRRPSRNRLHLRHRLVQARRRRDLRHHHRQQKCLGLRLQQVHYAVDYFVGLYPADHDEYGVGHFVVPVWGAVLV
jgi:hypothetical protein